MNEDKILEYLASIQQSVSAIQEDVAELKQRVTHLEDETQLIKAAVSKIEMNYEKRVKTLFDGFTDSRETVNTFESRLRKVELDVETHSIELRYLKAGIG